MKICYVYKSLNRQGVYLYLAGKDNFEPLPEALLKHFGSPSFVMTLPLINDSKSIAKINVAELKQSISEQGFYLQVDDQSENWLAEHRVSLGLSPNILGKE